ncbi:hypothetical protein AAFC00_006643 [Neodothiora populina]|uniref:C3H1-type domain-containing protein n=1 Tax=Neodothiora populina TaxID=2781224 RepID=A0ABR3PAN4_9PEZI
MFGRGQQNSNVCRFYQQGRCKFGNACKYEHPGANQPQGDQNSFAALSNNNARNNNNNNNNRPSGLARGDHYRPGSNQQGQQPLPYLMTKEGIETDLRNDRPEWPLSAYGPGRDAPRQLFGGLPLEQSFEEMRLMFYLAQAQGSVQAYIQKEEELLARSNQQVQQVLSNLDGAIQYVLAGKDEHPNRLDMCLKPGAGTQPMHPQPPVSSITPSGPAFGQPSAFGAAAPKPAFGAPAFGAPSQPGGFGQPSALGQNTAFGQPSSLAQGSAFGQPSAPGQSSGFGQPSMPGHGSAFGQASTSTQGSAFGQPSAPAQGSAFGQPSAPGQSGGFGQVAALGAKSPWGQPAATSQGGAFGQPSAPGQMNALGKPAFRQSAFGQASDPGQRPSPFGQASQGSGAFGQASQPSNQASPFASAAPASNTSGGFGQASAFGQPSQPVNNQSSSPFGQASNPDGQPSAFGQPLSLGASQPANPSPFGAPSQPQQNPISQQQSAFGQAAAPAFGQPSAPSPFGQPSKPSQSPFGAAPQAASPSPFGQAQSTQSNGSAHPLQPTGPLNSPDPSTYTRRDGNNKLTNWKNAPVQYMGDAGQPSAPYYRKADGSWERIWLPDGPPPPNPDLQDPRPEVYDAILEAAYAFVRETGTFKDGVMPEIPPMREWIRYDV